MRSLPSVPATFSVLPSMAKAVNGKVPIIFDSGIRRGQDAFKALASGADVVGLGRPVFYGLAPGGWKGVQSVLDLLNKELGMVMQLAGARTVGDIKRTVLICITVSGATTGLTDRPPRKSGRFSCTNMPGRSSARRFSEGKK